MDSSLHFPALYFKGDDFASREITLTIRSVVLETLHGDAGDEDKIVVYFKETKARAEKDGRPKSEKRMVLSKTLYVDMVTMFNSKETRDWENKRITLYRGKAIKGGKMVIRAKLAGATEPENSTEPKE